MQCSNVVRSSLSKGEKIPNTFGIEGFCRLMISFWKEGMLISKTGFGKPPLISPSKGGRELRILKLGFICILSFVICNLKKSGTILL